MSLQEEANLFYDEYSVVLEEYIDYKDMVNTGVVFDDFTKKEMRALSVLTPQNFKKELFNIPIIKSENLLDIYIKVADFYMEKEHYGLAERYLRKILAGGYRKPETCAKLSEVYEKIGNRALAAELLKMR